MTTPYKSLIISFFIQFVSVALTAQGPYIPASRSWTGLGDGHSWNNGQNWSPVYCTSPSGVISEVFHPPVNGEIVEFTSTGNVSVTGCPFIRLGNVSYDHHGYNNCGGAPSSEVNLYSLQINPFSYVTLDASINMGGSVSQTSGTNIGTALEIHEGRLTCTGLAGNYPQNGSSTPLNMNSMEAENSIIEITNPGTGGGFSTGGRCKLTNCTITCTSFQPNSNSYTGEIDVFKGCTINCNNVHFGPKCTAEMYNSTFNISGSTFGLNTYSTPNRVLLDNVQINVSTATSFTIAYRFGDFTMKGNISCQSTNPAFSLRFYNGTQNCTGPGGSAPCFALSRSFKVDGNVILRGGSVLVQDGNLNITGNIELNGTPDPSYSKTVSVNGQPAFSIGGIQNFVNYKNGPYGPIPGGFRYGITFSGSTDTHIKWPTGFPADSVTIAKTGCAKVYIDHPLYVTGKLEVSSGQLVLAPQPSASYALINEGNILLKDGGSISLGPLAHISLGGNFVDHNTTNDAASCQGFINPTGNIVAFYSGPYSPSIRTLGTASHTSMGNVKFINQTNVPFTLQNDIVTADFDFGSNATVILGNYNFSVRGALSNASNTRYFITNGTGSLKLANIGNTGVLFPIGSSSTSYNPVTISNMGVLDDFTARVQTGVYSSGIAGTPLTANAVNLTWSVDESTPGGSQASLTTQWNANNELAGFMRNNSYLAHFENNSWNYGSLITPLGSNPFTITRSNIMSFSPFAVVNPTAALPFILLDFTAKLHGDNVQISWTTSGERDFRGFDIERSMNGLDFSRWVFVPGKGTSGSSNVYTYKDDQPLPFYRLKLIDKDGQVEYSKRMAVQLSGLQNRISVFPNPTLRTDWLKVQLTVSENSTGSYQLFNTLGKLVMAERLSLKKGVQVIPVNIHYLSAGIYYLSVSCGETVRHFKVLKR